MTVSISLEVLLAVMIPFVVAWVGVTIKTLKDLSALNATQAEIVRQLTSLNSKTVKLQDWTLHHVETMHRI